jgi:hypothetical protein
MASLNAVSPGSRPTRGITRCAVVGCAPGDHHVRRRRVDQQFLPVESGRLLAAYNLYGHRLVRRVRESSRSATRTRPLNLTKTGYDYAGRRIAAAIVAAGVDLG